jgi:hypothetical protein
MVTSIIRNTQRNVLGGRQVRHVIVTKMVDMLAGVWTLFTWRDATSTRRDATQAAAAIPAPAAIAGAGCRAKADRRCAKRRHCAAQSPRHLPSVQEQSPALPLGSHELLRSAYCRHGRVRTRTS